jgi:glucan phosphoethanolaminetransferase (alkaline phosphatase superfamily)
VGDLMSNELKEPLKRITLSDLNNLAVFKIAFYSSVGWHLLFILFFLILLLFIDFDSSNMDSASGFLFAVFAIILNIIFGPLMLGGFMVLGRLVSDNAFNTADKLVIVFRGDDRKFHNLDSNSIYEVMLYSARGLMIIYALFALLVAAIAFLNFLFSGEWLEALYMIGISLFAAGYLYVLAFIWAFAHRAGSHIMKPLTKRFGIGHIVQY